MKKLNLISIFSSLLLIQVLILTSCKEKHVEPKKLTAFVPEIETIAEVIEETDPIVPRESITFILGEDRETDNPFYREAANYYQYSEIDKTDYVVKWCRSLLEVRDYLVENPPSNALPWGTINLVSHGNQWIGLSVEVIPESRRASQEQIRKYLDNDTFKKFPEHIIDSISEVNIHACGVGNNFEFVQIMGEVFSSKKTFPIVRASKLFEYYASTNTNGVIIESQRYFAKAWFTQYLRGYKPTDKIITNSLNEKYPECTVKWQDALSREKPRWIGDMYHVTFDVPVKWVIVYPHEDSLPDVSTIGKQRDWIYSQNEIVDALKKIEIPVEDFNWWFRNVYVNNDDGSKSPAIWVKGFSTILCILKPMLKEATNNELIAQGPFIPELDNMDYFYSCGGVSESCR